MLNRIIVWFRERETRFQIENWAERRRSLHRPPLTPAELDRRDNELIFVRTGSGSDEYQRMGNYKPSDDRPSFIGPLNSHVVSGCCEAPDAHKSIWSDLARLPYEPLPDVENAATLKD